jgi:hypothetical protein
LNKDLQLSSLIHLARALKLEFMLIPRPLILIVQSLVNHDGQAQAQTPAYRLPDEQ